MSYQGSKNSIPISTGGSAASPYAFRDQLNLLQDHVQHLLQLHTQRTQSLLYACENDYIGLYIEIKACEQAGIPIFSPQATSYTAQADELSQLVGWIVDPAALKTRCNLEKRNPSHLQDIRRRAQQLAANAAF